MRFGTNCGVIIGNASCIPFEERHLAREDYPDIYDSVGDIQHELQHGSVPLCAVIIHFREAVRICLGAPAESSQPSPKRTRLMCPSSEQSPEARQSKQARA